MRCEFELGRGNDYACPCKTGSKNISKKDILSLFAVGFARGKHDPLDEVRWGPKLGLFGKDGSEAAFFVEQGLGSGIEGDEDERG